MADIEEAAHAIHSAADSSTDSLIGWTKAYEQAIKDFQPKEVKDEGTQGNAGQTATGTAAEGDTQHGAEVGNEGNAATQGEVAKPAAESKPADTQFANNKIFTQSAVDAARARLKKKLGNVNSGIDPELLQDGLTLAGAYIEAGARSFAAYSKAMIDDLGDAIKPYLRSLYESVRHYPGLDTDGMTTSVDIDAIATHQEAAAPAEVKKEEKKPASLPETSGNKINTPPVISEIVKRLTGEGYKGIAEARAHLSDLTGTPIKTGTVEAKQADEALELAAVMRAKEIVRKGIARGQSSQAIYDALVDLYENKMPNLNVRTSTSVEQQAYSTPVPLAYIASRLAGINMESVVAEPTAGNGALLIVTDPKLVFANELNADRATALRSQGYANVSEEDGTTWSPPQKVDSVIANPPFGVVRDDKGVSKSFKINELHYKRLTMRFR